MNRDNRVAGCLQSRLLIVICVVWLLPPSNMVRADGHDDEISGAIEGIVTYSGDVPKSKVRDDAGQQRKLLAVDRRSHGLRYVLVYLEPEESQRPESSDSEIRKGGSVSNPIVIDQVEHTFQPHLIAIRDGQQVKFTNSDVANHNVRAIAFEPKNQFNVFTGAGGDYIHRFVTQKKLRPILLSCDIHPWMRGWIYVFGHPHFAVTDEQGKFRIPAVPPKKHRLVIWQPDVGYRETLFVDVQSQATSTVKIEIASENLKNL